MAYHQHRARILHSKIKKLNKKLNDQVYVFINNNLTLKSWKANSSQRLPGGHPSITAWLTESEENTNLSTMPTTVEDYFMMMSIQSEQAPKLSLYVFDVLIFSSFPLYFSPSIFSKKLMLTQNTRK